MKAKLTSLFNEPVKVLDLLEQQLEPFSLIAFSHGGRSSGVTYPAFGLLTDIVFKDGVRSIVRSTAYHKTYITIDGDLVKLRPIIYAINFPVSYFHSKPAEYKNFTESWTQGNLNFSFVRLQHYEDEMWKQLEAYWKTLGKTRADYFK